jgi:WD40 repeat protein
MSLLFENWNKVLVYEFSETGRRWIRVESIMTINDAVHDIAFAPNVGRSYFILGVATNKDLRIISIKNTEDGTKSDQSSKYTVRLAGHYNDHGSTVWRVCWNVTGTILATSGDDGQVRLWKANYMDDWKCVAVLRGDGQGGHSIPMTPSIFSQQPKFLAQ